jgi:hypothetical protein
MEPLRKIHFPKYSEPAPTSAPVVNETVLAVLGLQLVFGQIGFSW